MNVVMWDGEEVLQERRVVVWRRGEVLHVVVLCREVRTTRIKIIIETVFVVMGACHGGCHGDGGWLS